MAESSLESHIVTDGITDLHNLTLSFVNRFSDLLTGVLVKASEVKETSNEEQVKYKEEVRADGVCKCRLRIACLVFRKILRHLNRLWMKWTLFAKQNRLGIG